MKDGATPGVVSTTCAYCGVGCGVDITLHDAKPVSVEGMREHPANFGRLCVKGTHLLDTCGPENRLLHPSINGAQATWDEATKDVASRLSAIIAKHGKDAVAFYVSGQLLTEDYYIANKLMKGYIGSANIDTNSRLCMSSAVSAYKRAFGEDVVPCDYEDLEQTDVLVLVGSNAAWTHPVLFQRVERAKKQRPHLKVVVVDPRKTASVAMADMHLQLRPGSDAGLYNGLLHYAHAHQMLDSAFIDKHTTGFQTTLAACSPWTLEHTAAFCDVSVDALDAFYALFCSTKRVVSFYSMGINQSSSGVDKCNSIINAHLATGKLLYPGAGPFSITGQPNAMGGREVGGLANQLAAHLDIDNPQHQHAVQTFWQSPCIATTPGKKAVDLFDDVASGKIKAVWIMATNPVVSLPERNKIEQALSACECVIVSDCVAKNDTLKFANIVLPASGWLEKDGTVTNSERTISRQRGVVSPVGSAKHDWQIMCDVAKAMGFDGFDYNGPCEIFDEWARMTATVNGKERQLNLACLAGMNEAQYNRMSPKRWPFDANGRSTNVFANNQFSTADNKARFIAIKPALAILPTNDAYPLVMNSGRMRDQWHTMTRTGRASALSLHSPFPCLQIHPQNAAELEIAEGDIVQAQSACGEVQAYASLTDAVRKNNCFMPIHWNAQFASNASVCSLYDSITDPLSGQPETKQAPVKLLKTDYTRFISVFSKQVKPCDAPFWVRSKRDACEHVELALESGSASLHDYAQALVAEQGEWISATNKDVAVSLLINNKQLLGVAFEFSSRQAQQNRLPAQWVESCFNTPLTFEQITQLLNAQPDPAFLQGRLICSCHSVREKPIVAAIQAGADTVEALGEKLKCGTNCGSCKSELAQVIEQTASSLIVGKRQVS